VTAASRVYEAELAAMEAYARESCGECPGEARFFLAGSRYAFEKAVALHPRDPKALLGLANVTFSVAFIGDGEPIDSVLNTAEAVALRARSVARDEPLRSAAESLLARIHAVPRTGRP
jgi:hypothetical protein